MMNNSANKNSMDAAPTSQYRYKQLLEAWNALPKRSLARRRIVQKLGLDRSYVVQLISKTMADEPMRAAYHTILNNELGIEEDIFS